jgi:hypothetical protein
MATRQICFHDRPAAKVGRKAEHLVASFLRSLGWYVLHSYGYDEGDDKPPLLTTKSKSLIIPDLDISKDGHRYWLEVKYKAKATFHRVSGVWEHGINLRQYLHYQQVEAITGCAVFLSVVENSSGRLLVSMLAKLPEGRRYSGCKMDKHGMVFWPVDYFSISQRWGIRRLAPLPEEAHGGQAAS